MARRTKTGVALPTALRKRVRQMVLEAGVAATAKTLNTGRDHVLAATTDLPLLSPAVAAFLTTQLNGSNQAA